MEKENQKLQHNIFTKKGNLKKNYLNKEEYTYT